MTDLICEALKLAIEAHEGQTDIGGQPYILHPLHIMSRMKTLNEQLLAIIHDVFEDSPTPISRLGYLEFPEEVQKAAFAITRQKGEDYRDYIRRVADDPLATAVKLADLSHNMRLDRIPEPKKRDYDRMERYVLARHYLLQYGAKSP